MLLFAGAGTMTESFLSHPTAGALYALFTAVAFELMRFAERLGIWFDPGSLGLAQHVVGVLVELVA